MLGDESMKVSRLNASTYVADDGRILIYRRSVDGAWLVVDSHSITEHVSKSAAVAAVSERLSQRQVSG